MLDVIRKSDVITALVTECSSAVEAEEGEAREVAINLLTALISDVNETPTLDVALVRHGHWAEKKLGLVCREVVCSECEQPPIKTGSCSYWMGDYAPKYCPNCGAKMDAGQEEDNDA